MLNSNCEKNDLRETWRNTGEEMQPLDKNLKKKKFPTLDLIVHFRELT